MYEVDEALCEQVNQDAYEEAFEMYCDARIDDLKHEFFYDAGSEENYRNYCSEVLKDKYDLTSFAATCDEGETL